MTTFDFTFMIEAVPQIILALPVSLFVTIVAVCVGYLFGLGLSMLKLCRYPTVRSVVSAITTITHGIPIVVILFIVFFGLPIFMMLFGIDINRWSNITFAIIAIVIDVAALSSEMFRSAYLSIDKGQIDAAKSIGMNRIQRFIRVIMPQGLYVILPNISNNLVLQFQNTSLIYTLGILDIMGMAKLIDGNAFESKSFECYMAASVIYWAGSVLFAQGFKFLERFYGKGMKAIGAVEKKPQERVKQPNAV